MIPYDKAKDYTRLQAPCPVGDYAVKTISIRFGESLFS